jgi:hypothetical protein
VDTGPARLLADLDAQPWPDRERLCHSAIELPSAAIPRSPA